MSGPIEDIIKDLTSRIGLPAAEGVIASAHFHAHAFWGLLGPVLASLGLPRWLALAALLPVGWAVLAEGGKDGRDIDWFFRLAGCVPGLILGGFLWVTHGPKS